MLDLAQMIDHTLLKPDATKEDIENLCKEAIDYQFYSVCVHPVWVKTASEFLKNRDVKVCTVIGFPLGATTSEVKSFETKQALDSGADEVDMVINIGALKSGHYDLVEFDIGSVVNVCRNRALVKVIIETSLLTDAEKVTACKTAVKAGANFVKTSTGFSDGGATASDITLMRKTVGTRLGVKASGGIKDRNTARAMVNAGANRIGASASVAIVEG
mgnify:CR=1 FL=1